MDLYKLLNERVEEYDKLCSSAGSKNDLYGKEIVVFGSSTAGKAFLDYLQSKGIIPVAFCDNDKNKQNTVYNDIPIYSLQHICENYDVSKINFIIPSASFDIMFFIERQLEDAGVNKNNCWNLYRLWSLEADIAEFLRKIKFMSSYDYWSNPASNGKVWLLLGFVKNSMNTDYENQPYMDFLLKNKEKVEKVYGYLADDKSRDIYSKYLYATANKNVTTWEAYCILKSIVGKIEDQYFDDEIIKLGEDETFIDAGALDGGTVIDFLKKCNYRYSSIISFEPDPVNAEKTRENLQKLNLHDYHLLENALYDKKQKIYFLDSMDGGSRVNAEGNISIEAVALDDVLNSLGIKNASYIKMDIEGAEIPALLGAKGTIQQNKPKLAICVYHKADDIFNIPILIKEICPEYKLYIRSYSFLWETVCYAI